MTKDRLADLVAASNHRLHRGPLADSLDEYEELEMPDITDEQRDFMSEFFAEVEEIREMLDKIQANVEEVKMKHSTILSQPNTDEKTKMELESLMANIKATADEVREQLLVIQLGKIELKMEPRTYYMSESTLLRMHEIQHSILYEKFFHVMMEYNWTQIDYRERCKDRMQQQLEITGRTTTDEEQEETLEQGNPALVTQEIVTDTKQAKQTLADTEAGHIIKLENSIREVYDLFGGMARVMKPKRETVVRIEDYVNYSVDSIETDMKETKETCGFQSAARRKIMIAVCLTVVGLILASTIAGYLGLK